MTEDERVRELLEDIEWLSAREQDARRRGFANLAADFHADLEQVELCLAAEQLAGVTA
jgi:hypothetical protein